MSWTKASDMAVLGVQLVQRPSERPAPGGSRIDPRASALNALVAAVPHARPEERSAYGSARPATLIKTFRVARLRSNALAGMALLYSWRDADGNDRPPQYCVLAGKRFAPRRAARTSYSATTSSCGDERTGECGAENIQYARFRPLVCIGHRCANPALRRCSSPRSVFAAL